MALPQLMLLNEPPEPRSASLGARASRRVRGRSALQRWIRIQGISVLRHSAALRPFRKSEFGTGPESPSEAHRLAANRLLGRLQKRVLAQSARLRSLGDRVRHAPSPGRLRIYTAEKQRAIGLVKETEKVWEFYFDLFNQRRTHMAPMLLAADRIGLDCYQAVYSSLGRARSVPSPAPFSYQETALAPATFRRGVRISRIGRRENPFPLVKLPHHRLVNPWTLGAVAHEVAHNLQADLGLWTVVPRQLFHRLVRAGVPRPVAAVWSRWHKEIWADLVGLLLIGPAYVGSLMDVVAHSQRRATAFNPAGVHPTPYLRVFINLELVRRMGFHGQERAYRHAWSRLYPPGLARRFPRELMRTFSLANRLVVDTICFQRNGALGNKSMAEVVRFTPQSQAMIEEASRRLAAGTNPGIVPERFFISASRLALERRLARPGVIARNFYDALARR